MPGLIISLLAGAWPWLAAWAVLASLAWLLSPLIMARKVTRAMHAAIPGWLAVVLSVALIIPGPQDEIAVTLAVVILIIVQPVRRRRAASAWRGGKSHRVSDARTSLNY